MSILEQYETVHRTTGNALYAWEALTCCDWTQPLPPWLFQHLINCAHSPSATGLGVLDLAAAVSRGELSADRAASLTPRALGFRGEGSYNAFAALAKLREDFRFAWHVDVARASWKQEAAFAELEATGMSRSQVFRKIGRGRRLWEAQAK